MTRLGMEELVTARRHLIEGKRVGLVSNYTMTDGRFRPVIHMMANESAWKLVKLFGPEHGVKNSAKEGEHVHFSIDPATNLPAYSLYGNAKKPTREMLEDLDVLVVDLADIGCRYYTNMNTLAYCMEACGEVGLPCVVTDRPNPIGGAREGNILDPAFSSFVGMHPIPNRHGLTMGELAGFINSRLATPCELTVVRVADWTRNQLLSETGLPFVPSSPNTTSLDMCLLYPGTCLFEGTNVSLGRGTTHPFEYIGAPYVDGHALTNWFNALDLPGIVARPIYFVPTYSQYTGDVCEGVALHITDARRLEPVRAGIELVQGIAAMHPGDFAFLEAPGGGTPFFDLLAGTDRLRLLVQRGEGVRYLDEAREALARFDDLIAPYELYP